MINYLTTDTLPEIVDKNKSNILYLLQEFADGGISYKDLVAKVEANAVTAAKAISDAAAAQAKADSHDQPIRNNAAAALAAQQTATQATTAAAAAQAKADAHDQPIRNNAAAALAAQQKADQNAADIVKAVADINANASAIARIINDGIGGYLGTYRATDGDDFTVLPQSANDKERAITEFPEANEIFYQEWEWKTPGGWTKLGSKTDSHIHSQSAGISLADVTAQQDPKIQKALTDAKTYSDSLAKNYIDVNLYEDKTFVIPSASLSPVSSKTLGPTTGLIYTLNSGEVIFDIDFTEDRGYSFVKISSTKWQESFNSVPNQSGVIEVIGNELRQTKAQNALALHPIIIKINKTTSSSFLVKK